MTLPLENLDDRSFEDLVNDAIARIRVYAPEWTDYNKTDPGITMIELLAWIVEMQIYRLNKVSDRSRLKFLKLLGFSGLRPARAARADLNFAMLDSPTVLSSMHIPAYTQVAAIDPAMGGEVIFETDRDLNLVNSSLKAVLTIPFGEPLIDNTKANDNESVKYSAFGTDPSKGDALYLGLDSNPKGQENALAFYISHDLPWPARCVADGKSNVILVWEYYTGGSFDSDMSWKALVKRDLLEDSDLDVVKDDTCDLTMTGKAWVRVQGDAARTPIDGHDLFWLRIRVDKPGYYIPPVLDRILLNVVSATQKATFKASFSSSGLPSLQISLGHAPVIEGSLELGIRGESTQWTQVADLDASGPGTRHYVLDPLSGIISFGDGIRGKIPPEGRGNIIVTFSSGAGIRGNVPSYTIKKLLDFALAKKVSVINRRPAAGGEEPGTLEEAILKVRKELRSPYRAITPGDYEEIARNTPGQNVARAKAIPFYHPSISGPVPDTVTLIVVPRSSKPMPVPSLEFLKAVYRYVDIYRTMGAELFVIGPEYVEVSVKVTVIMTPLYLKKTVQDSIRQRLDGFLSTIKTEGADGEGWPFGRPVYISEIYALLDGTKGVDYVKKLTLIANGREINGDLEIPEYALARPGAHTIDAYSEEEYEKSSREEV